jgi:prenyltransferase beta subunit
VKRVVLVAGCLLAFVLPLRAETADQKKASVAYVVKLQNKDGGFRPSADVEKSSLRATSSALRAIKYFGGEVPNREACIKFVESCFDRDSGGFADAPGGKPDVAVTAVGFMAVVELKMDVEKYMGPVFKYLDENAKSFEELRIAAAGFEPTTRKPPRAGEWIQQVKKMANADGTFGKGDGQARDTGGAVVLLLRLGYKLSETERDKVISTFDAGQRADGGFGKADVKGSDLETTYRVLRCFHMLQLRPKSAEGVLKFVASCRNPDGGYGVEPGKPSSVSATYFAAIVTKWVAEAK